MPNPIPVYLPSPAPRPFVKWVGGKRQLLNILNAAAPKIHGKYFEPFLGGGAFLFSRLPSSATISDANPELINCYLTIRDYVEPLLENLSAHENTETHFYITRSENLSGLTQVQRASRFIFLNKTCWNGLYRENKSGQFNTPFGRYKNPKIVDTENLRAVSHYLKTSGIDIENCDYRQATDQAQPGDFVYLDPPYVPLTKTASFAGYMKGGFGIDDPMALAKVFTGLVSLGVSVMTSNSNTATVRDLYKNFNIETVHASRSVNCKPGCRGKEANEVLITCLAK